MNSSIILLALACLSFNIATIASAAQCPSSPPTRQNLDISKYVGTWYLLVTGKVWHGEQNNIDCILERYDRRSDNPLLLDITWAARFNGTTWRDDKGLITLNSLAQPNRWDFYMDETVFHSTIVATDHNNWTIEYSCIESGGVVKENYMIRSRTYALQPEVLDALKTIVEGLGVNPADFVTIRQSNCE